MIAIANIIIIFDYIWGIQYKGILKCVITTFFEMRDACMLHALVQTLAHVLGELNPLSKRVRMRRETKRNKNSERERDRVGEREKRSDGY
jgi:hypothetical protein